MQKLLPTKICSSLIMERLAFVSPWVQLTPGSVELKILLWV